MRNSQNRIASAEDFRRVAEFDRRASAERVVLPKSRLAVRLARPPVRWFLFHQRLPLSLAARVGQAGHAGEAEALPFVPESEASGTGGPSFMGGLSSSGGSSPVGRRAYTNQEAAALAEWVVALVQKTVVEPRLSLRPGPDEISPDWLAQEDVDFILRYAVGEVAPLSSSDAAPAEGEVQRMSDETGDLAPFRRERGPSADRASGGDLSPVAVGAAQDGPDGFSD